MTPKILRFHLKSQVSTHISDILSLESGCETERKGGAKMQYKNLGRSGLKVSQLSFGAWVTFGNQLDVKEAKSILQCCRDHGVNFFDNAEVYANGRAEEIMGQAIRELGWKRSDLVISTKLFWGGPGPNDKGLSRKHIIEGTKASLKRLDMDYVDVLYCHRPDVATPVEETVRAMNHVIDHGWAFYWGTSEWSAQQITEAWAVAQRLDLVGPIVEQPEYNLFNRHKVEVEYLPLYNNHGLGLTTWSPLASGVLTGKYNNGVIPADSRFALENYKVDFLLTKRCGATLNLANRSLVDDVLRKVKALAPIADELHVPLSQLAIAWCAANPNVSSVITGATKESQAAVLAFRRIVVSMQIHENMKAVDVIPLLTPEVLEKIEAAAQTKPKRAESYSPQNAENCSAFDCYTTSVHILLRTCVVWLGWVCDPIKACGANLPAICRLKHLGTTLLRRPLAKALTLNRVLVRRKLSRLLYFNSINRIGAHSQQGSGYEGALLCKRECSLIFMAGWPLNDDRAERHQEQLLLILLFPSAMGGSSPGNGLYCGPTCVKVGYSWTQMAATVGIGGCMG
ncbi:ATP-sensitive inward rectifier potassium channel 1 [Asimina triloba]